MAKTPKPTPAAPPQTSAEILAAINNLDLGALGGTAQERRRLGAPEEVAARNPNLPPDFVPWLDGDEWEPEGYSPDVQARLKAQMAAAGLYGSDGYRPGGWDRGDAQALTQVLEFANGRGISDVAEATREFASYTTTVGPLARKVRAPLVTRLQNPESVRQVIRSTSLNLLGRRLSDQEEQKLISGYQQMSAASQPAEYAAEEGGGTVTAPMGVEDYAVSRLENAEGAGAQRYLKAFDRIHQSLTGNITEGPNVSKTGAVEW